VTRISRRARLVPTLLLAYAAGGCGGAAAADTSKPPLAARASASTSITPQQRAASDAALAAFQGYMRVRVQIAADPDPATATARLARYVADPLKVNLVSYVRGLKAADQAVRGTPTFKVQSQVIHADTTPMTVDLRVCVDPDGWYTVWLKNGAAIESKHNPPYPIVAHVEDYGAPYGWLVVTVTPGGKSC
jgi:hypothetical protein